MIQTRCVSSDLGVKPQTQATVWVLLEKEVKLIFLEECVGFSSEERVKNGCGKAWKKKEV